MASLSLAMTRAALAAVRDRGHRCLRLYEIQSRPKLPPPIEIAIVDLRENGGGSHGIVASRCRRSVELHEGCAAAR
jgi:hypothetical protein